MTVLLVLTGVMLVFIFGSLLMVLFLFNKVNAGEEQPIKKTASDTPNKFPWKAVILPLVSLVLVLIMIAWFWGKLPLEVGANFDDNGIATSWTTRGTLIMWAILPELLLTAIAFLVVWGVNRISTLVRTAEEAGLNLNSLLVIMGNMIAVPQLILGFALLNIFGYNAYQVRILPLWLIVLVIAAVGAVILGAFFIRNIQKMWQANK
jgi:hypothetical protein